MHSLCGSESKSVVDSPAPDFPEDHSHFLMSKMDYYPIWDSLMIANILKRFRVAHLAKFSLENNYDIKLIC